MILESISYSKNYHRFRRKANESGWFYHFVASDVHLDNPKCKRKKLKADLDLALEKDATISITGDLLDLMQGKFDRRASKSALRKQFVEGGTYFDNVIEDACEFLEPYVNNILLISDGNHETSVKDKIEVDILQYLIRELNKRNGTQIQHGGYRGYFVIEYFTSGTTKMPIKFGYTHGNFGGNVTKGSLSVLRNASIMPDCDIMLSGHTHDSWHIPHKRYSLSNQKEKIELTTQHHVRTGTYKEEFEGGQGWAVEKVSFPKPIGGCMCKFKFKRGEKPTMRFELTVD